MRLRLKRNEDLREGLQRITEQRLSEVLETVSGEELSAEQVHRVRTEIKGLRATLRLAGEAVDKVDRQERREALGELADHFSGPRDAVVQLEAFERICHESLEANGSSRNPPRWVGRTQKVLGDRAKFRLEAGTYHGSAERVRRLAGRFLPFSETVDLSGSWQTRRAKDWESTVALGLHKTYRKGRRLWREIRAVPEAADDQWHELRKEVKALGEQMGLVRKLKGTKRLLDQIGKVGATLGKARDLDLLGNFLRQLTRKRKLGAAEEQSYQLFLSHMDRQREELRRRASEIALQLYRRSAHKFSAGIAKRWQDW